jgi:hypothetical protein
MLIYCFHFSHLAPKFNFCFKFASKKKIAVQLRLFIK